MQFVASLRGLRRRVRCVRRGACSLHAGLREVLLVLLLLSRLLSLLLSLLLMLLLVLGCSPTMGSTGSEEHLGVLLIGPSARALL